MKKKEKVCTDFSEFLQQVIQDLLKEHRLKWGTAKEVAEKTGVSQPHISRILNNGLIPSLEIIKKIEEKLELDIITQKLLCLHAGYTGKLASLFPQKAKDFVENQKTFQKYFYNKMACRAITTFCIPAMFQIEKYMDSLLNQWKGTQYEATQEQIDEFIQIRKKNQELFFKECPSPSQFIIYDVLLEKSILLPKDLMVKQIQRLVDDASNYNFIEIRLLDIKDKFSIPPTFFIYETAFICVEQDVTCEYISKKYESELFSFYSALFDNYWNYALSKEESLKKLLEIQANLLSNV